MQKDDSKISDGTEVDSELKSEDTSVSQHSTKPNVPVAQLRYPHDVNEARNRIIFVENNSCKAKSK